MPKACDKACRWDFTDRNQTTIKCHECDQRELLRPLVRNETLRELLSARKWVGPELNLSGGKVEQPKQAQAELMPAQAPHQAAQVPATRLAQTFDTVEYQAPDGQTVSLTTRMFKQMICPEANEDQSRYMLGWCAHNRIDPFSNEAYFQVMSGKPVIQVSKDAWFRRMERHPQFVSHQSGIIVETTVQRLKAALLVGDDFTYLISDAMRARLLKDAEEEKAVAPKGWPERFTIKKLGQFLGDDTLVGGWAEIIRSDRPKPYVFQVDKKGWETKKDGAPNVFWENKAPFMIWKTALKNCTRLAFPELSGLMAVPEMPDDFDPAAAADYELAETEKLRSMLFTVGAKVPPPVGPLKYQELHKLCVLTFDGKGISELSHIQLAGFVSLIEQAAQGNQETLSSIKEDLGHGRITEIDGATVLGESGNDDYQPSA